MLTITQKANDYILNSGITEIRFGVKTNKGCAGFEYIWQKGYPGIDDYRININDDYTLLIDKTLKKYIDNCEIDLEETELEHKIVFNNEKVSVQCGCGESLDFPDDIQENDTLWEDQQTYRFFYSVEEWQSLARVQDNGDLTLELGEVNIDKKIKKQGDTVKEVPSKKVSEKYKQWRELK
jgi:Fe-S cluster assembly iron-binding protein IscA